MKRHYRFALGAILLAGCGSKEAAHLISPAGNRVAIIGHGGMGNPGINNPYQLNSFIGLTRAVNVYRLDGIEMDLQLSRDSVLFLLHDDYLEALTYCSGCIATLDSAVVASCGLRPVGSGQLRADPVTPLERVLAFVSSRLDSTRVFLDIHGPNACIPDEAARAEYYGRLLRALGRLLSRYELADRVAVQSGEKELLEHAKTILPGVPLYLDYCQTIDDVHYAQDKGFAGVAAQTALFSGELVAAAHEAKLLVQLYDAGSQKDIEQALAKGPDYFLADNLVLTQQIAEAMDPGR